MIQDISYHIPVLRIEAVDSLNIKKGCWYIDCNFGGGGHTREILERGGSVLAIDVDPEAIERGKEELASFISEGRLKFYQINFSEINEAVEHSGVNASGVLYDLGVSSHQLETGERGFSFNLDAPLDMRMDPVTQAVSAKDLINGLGLGELIELFTKLGEERYSRVIAKRIVEERKKNPITTTNQLAKIITSVRRSSSVDRTHPATRVFQALRIAVNDELNSLRESLPRAFECLNSGGRIAVISFHSLEDRIVKNYFKDLEDKGLAKNLFKKPLTPTDQEVSDNPRARSGKLRAIEKI